MAQSGYTPILIYGSGTASAVPTAGNLTSSSNGAELALNYADGKLYFKNSSGVVTLLASSATAGGTSPGGSTTQVQYNNAGAFAGSSNLTFDGTNLTSGGTVTATKLIPTGNVTAGNGMYLPTTNTLAFSTDGSERMRILSGGKVLINATTDRDKWDNSTIGSNLLQVERSVSGGNSSISIATNPGTSADVFSLLFLGRSRGTANNDYTAVASGDGLGAISFQGADGTEFVEAASIRGHVDGTPGANDMPGRLMFFTTPDGSATSTERMRITSAGNVGIGTSSPSYKLDVSGASASGIARFINSWSDGANPAIIVDGTGGDGRLLELKSGGTRSWPLFRVNANSTDVLLVNGDSTIKTAGTISVGGATPSTSGAGITFPATQSASSDANTLDDYEEGTWTPSVGGNASYNSREGNYVKIGKQVTVNGSINVDAIGTGSAHTVSGLPFSATINVPGSCSFFTSVTNLVTCIPQTNADTTFTLVGLTAAGASFGTQNVFQNNTIVRFSITYFV